jgi:hypothetical protein
MILIDKEKFLKLEFQCCEGWVLKKTVRKAERAWFLFHGERRANPVSEGDFLTGEILRIFETLSLGQFDKNR